MRTIRVNFTSNYNIKSNVCYGSLAVIRERLPVSLKLRPLTAHSGHLSFKYYCDFLEHGSHKITAELPQFNVDFLPQCAQRIFPFKLDESPSVSDSFLFLRLLK